MVSKENILELGRMLRNKPFCFIFQIAAILWEIKISKMERNIKAKLVHHLGHLFFM